METKSQQHVGLAAKRMFRLKNFAMLKCKGLVLKELTFNLILPLHLSFSIKLSPNCDGVT